MFERGQKRGLVFMPSKNWRKRDQGLRYEVSCWVKKKKFEKRKARHLKKRRACQEDPNNKKIKVCDKIML